MKNTKLSKIILLALSVAVLVGCALAFSVSAAEEENDGIVLKNLYYDEKVAILFAVDATVGQAENGDVTVEYYWDDATDDVKQATYYPDDGTLGTDYPVFITEGLAAKELGKLAHVTFTDASGAKHEETYSVAEYLYKRLYVDGVVNAEEADGKDYYRKGIYENLLDYGANAQKLFGYNQENPVNKSTIAYTAENSGITIDGGRYAFALAGSAMTLNLEYSGTEVYTGFKVGTNLVRKATSGATVARAFGVNEISLYTGEIPKYVYDFEDNSVSGFTLYTFSKAENGTIYAQNEVTANSALASETAYYGSLGKLIKDPTNEVNQVLSITTNDGANNSNTKYAANQSVIELNARETTGGKIHIVEFDFYLAKSTKTIRNPFELYAYDSSDEEIGYIARNSTDAKYTSTIRFTAVTEETPVKNAFNLAQGNSATAENADVALFDSHKWYTFRITWDQANNKVYYEVKLNDTWYRCFNQDRVTADYSSKEVDHLGFKLGCYGFGAIYYFDNIDYVVVDTLPTISTVLGNDTVEHPAE